MPGEQGWRETLHPINSTYYIMSRPFLQEVLEERDFDLFISLPSCEYPQ